MMRGRLRLSKCFLVAAIAAALLCAVSAALGGVVTTSGLYTGNTAQTPASLPGTVTPPTTAQTFRHNYVNGTGAADKVDTVYSTTLTFVASTPQTLNLVDNSSGTQVTDFFGAAINFQRVRKITIKNRSTTDGVTLTVSPGATNGWTALLGTGSTLIVQPSSSINDGGVIFTAPNTTGWVTSGTSKTLKLDPGTNAFSIDIEIVGAST